MDKYNAIFREYYSHEGADCFKIRMPFTRYGEEKLVLCPVSDGEEKAIRLAREAVLQRVDEVLPPLPSEESGEPRQGGEPSGLVEEDEHDIAFRKMKERIRDTAPERIYLNVGPTDSFDEGADFPSDEVTWCKDEIDSFDVPYIRADLVRGAQAAQPPAEAPEADPLMCLTCKVPVAGLMDFTAAGEHAGHDIGAPEADGRGA